MTTPPDPDRPTRALAVAAGTAAAYALAGWLALTLAGPPGYASPLYPSAGIALAAALSFGRAALPGVWLGSFAVNIGLGLMRSQSGFELLLLPLLIGLGATLQTALGAALVRRYVPGPLVLQSPREVVRAGVLGALVACVVSPSVATPALLAAGAITPAAWFSNWLTWWVGDTLGVLIATPLALTLIGRPRADWQPRRRTVGLPLLLALGLMAAAVAELKRVDEGRRLAGFERDADRLAHEVQTRLQVPLYALQALNSAARAQGELDQRALASAASWWLRPGTNLRAAGYSVRVARSELPAFEAAARAEGLADYKVFDREAPPGLADDADVVAVRQIEPRQGNAAALGVNALSVPAARAALAATRRSGEPSASAGFRLTQSGDNELGLVFYQALYRGEPHDAQARQAQFRGLVFVSVQAQRLLADLAAAAPPYLRWCIVDPGPGSAHRRVAGPAGCEGAAVAGELSTVRQLQVADRGLEMRLTASADALPGAQRESTGLLSMAGLAAATMLGALLLVITGHSRRTELAVQSATAELRREIDERTQVQDALRESELRLRSLLDQVPIGVMFLTPEGNVIEINPRLCELSGYTAEALRGHSVLRITHPDELVAMRSARRALLSAPGTVQIRQARLRHADGHDLWVRASITALRDAGGRVRRVACAVEDITEHLRLAQSERALDRAEAASRAKSEFVSRMSHELRTPLNAMLGFAQLMGMDREPGLAPHQNEWAAQIQRAGWHLLEMINETLDLARIESGAVRLDLRPVALAPLAAECQAMVAAAAAKRGITVALAIAPGLAAVMADPTRLKQVLTNLLSNAVKYNRDGGSVTVAARAAAAGQVELTVSDSGLGMTPAQMAGLFQPYNRLGRESSGIEGIGIGLVISQRLTELMGGTLRADSREGLGSVFTLTLAQADAAELPDPPLPDAAAAPYRRRRVHYVEDNETNVELMRGVLLQRPQIELEVSTIGLDGLSAVRAQRPDLILLDMQLPDISGLELLRHFKQDDALTDIPVVVVSADATTERIEQALTLGAAHYATKPLDVARFLEIVDSLLDRSDTHWGV